MQRHRAKASIFQSTLPRRERHYCSNVTKRRNRISIHAPAKGATRTDSKTQMEYLNFNPRSREGSDLREVISSMLHMSISIHAPAKGATPAPAVPRPVLFSISIHAPAKGATSSNAFISSFKPYFNPRSREGSDEREAEKRKSNDISIHAPAKGAT